MSNAPTHEISFRYLRLFRRFSEAYFLSENFNTLCVNKKGLCKKSLRCAWHNSLILKIYSQKVTHLKKNHICQKFIFLCVQGQVEKHSIIFHMLLWYFLFRASTTLQPFYICSDTVNLSSFLDGLWRGNFNRNNSKIPRVAQINIYRSARRSLCTVPALSSYISKPPGMLAGRGEH